MGPISWEWFNVSRSDRPSIHSAKRRSFVELHSPPQCDTESTRVSYSMRTCSYLPFSSSSKVNCTVEVWVCFSAQGLLVVRFLLDKTLGKRMSPSHSTSAQKKVLCHLWHMKWIWLSRIVMYDMDVCWSLKK